MIEYLPAVVGTLFVACHIALVAGLCRCLVEVAADNHFEMVRWWMR